MAKAQTSLQALMQLVTTKAITKGIAIATAVLAATALFGAFTDAIKNAVTEAGKTGTDLALQFQGVLDVADPRNLVGLIIGAAVVFLFSGLAVNAVSRAAGAVVVEVREQFRLHPGIMKGTEKPDYARVVDICTRDSLRELVTPGLLAVMAPIAVGFGLGVGALGAYLAVQSVPELLWQSSYLTQAVLGITLRRWLKMDTMVERTQKLTQQQSWVTPLEIHSRTLQALQLTHLSRL